MNHEYAEDKLSTLLRDINQYTADEFRRQMARIITGATGQDVPDDCHTIKTERDALAVKIKILVKEKRIATEKQRAAEVLLKKAIKVPVNHKGLIPFMVYDYDSTLKNELNDYLCMTDNDWENRIKELQAEAGRAGFIAGCLYDNEVHFNDAPFDINIGADVYAAKIRQGGA